MNGAMIRTEQRLADRLGTTVHVSPLRFKLERLRRDWPSDSANCLEDWLVDVANARGVRVVERPDAPAGFQPPPREAMSNEELVVGLCQLQCLDRPQMLRLAAQLISRGDLDWAGIIRLARRERVTRVLGELSRLALRIDPQHAGWRRLQVEFGGEPSFRDVLLHWTRLAEPIMQPGRPNAAGWKLVA